VLTVVTRKTRLKHLIIQIVCEIMIDLINFIVGCIAAFILGLAGHSTYLHAKRKYKWKFPWDHEEEETEK